jgi:Redoxin
VRRREEARSGLDVILIDIWEGTDPKPDVDRFCELWGVDSTILLDETAEYAAALGIRGVPTNVLVDADGTIVDVGLVRLDELEAAIDRLVGR